MGVLSNISNFLGLSQPQVVLPDAADLAITGQAGAAGFAGQVGPSDAAPAGERSITQLAMAELHKDLMRQPVTRYGNASARFPIGGIEISADSMGGGYVARDEEKRPHGERIRVAVKLSQPITDYEKATLETALRNTLGTKVPAFAGKLIGKPANDETPSYQDVGKVLVALLEARKARGEKDLFEAGELAVIENFFEAHCAKKDRADSEWDQAIEASHHDNKVVIRINASELPSDANAEPKISSDAVITEFFEKHREAIMGKFKQKAVALGIVSEADLQHLDMHVGCNGWNIAIHFANKPEPLIDPVTQKPYAGDEYVNKMGATPLAKIDTKELGKIFTDTLLETSMDSPIMARIMDAHMFAQTLRARAGNDNQITQFLNQHDMFKSPEEVTKEEERALAEHKIMLDRPDYSKSRDGVSDEMRLDFELPPGMKLNEVLEGIVSAQGTHAARVQAEAANDNAVGLVV